MTLQSPRIYLYKITFEEVPYYYYGIKKEKYFNQEYWGSPVTHKWCWEFYTPKKQILEIFPYTDEGWIEAQEVEKRLIKAFYNEDKWCLNENVGGILSLYSNEKYISDCIKRGKNLASKMKKLNKAIYGLSTEERIKFGKKGGEIIGNTHKQNGTGVCGISLEKRIENGKKYGSNAGKKGSKKTNSQKWQCTVTNYISTPAGLSNYQNKRGIDTSNRKKLIDY